MGRINIEKSFEVFKGIVISTASFIIPLSFSLLLSGGEPFMGNSTPSVKIILTLVVSLITSAITLFLGINMLKNGNRTFGISLLIPASLYWIFILFTTHCFGLFDKVFRTF